jgi:hypothetical protein
MYYHKNIRRNRKGKKRKQKMKNKKSVDEQVHAGS